MYNSIVMFLHVGPAYNFSSNPIEVWRPFRVSAGRCAVTLNEVDHGVAAVYGAELHQTVCMAPQHPRLKPS